MELTKLEPMSAQDALNELTEHLLGKDFYIEDPVGPTQANAIIVDTIKQMYRSFDERKLRRFSLFGKKI